GARRRRAEAAAPRAWTGAHGVYLPDFPRSGRRRPRLATPGRDPARTLRAGVPRPGRWRRNAVREPATTAPLPRGGRVIANRRCREQAPSLTSSPPRQFPARLPDPGRAVAGCRDGRLQPNSTAKHPTGYLVATFRTTSGSYRSIFKGTLRVVTI